MEENIVKLYIELGFLSLCGLIIVILAVIGYKKISKSFERSDKLLEEKNQVFEDNFKEMLNLIKKQNQDYQDLIIREVAFHTPSIDESTKLTKVSEEIDCILQQMLLDTGASRVSLIQYHNGGHSVNKQSFLKMSMSNEVIQVGMKPFISEFKDQFRSVLAFYTKELNERGYCYIENFETLFNIDNSMYEFLKCRNIQSKFGIAVHNKDHLVVGFLDVEFLDKEKVNLGLVKKSFNENKSAIETLLSL